MTAPCAWLDKQGGYVYLKVGRRWYGQDLSCIDWDPIESTIAEMDKCAMELHPMVAAKLDTQRLLREAE